MHEEIPESLPFELGEAERPIPVDAPRTCREPFIPLQKADLVRHLSSDPELPASERQHFVRLTQRLETSLHHEFRQKREELKQLYSVFDPDSDTKLLTPPNAAERNALVPEVFEKVTRILEQANFCKLSPDAIEDAIETASHWGLKLNVDFDAFEHLLVFVRGDIMGRRTCRRWGNLYRPEEIDVSIYQRLVIVFRLRKADSDAYADTSKIYLKLFKNIPKIDIDMLLPGTRVRMTWLDRGQILLPTVTGFGIAMVKVFQGAFTLAVAGLYGFLALLGLVGGTIGYAIRSFMGYMRTKDRYQLNLTRSLYFQNLATNAGVLFRLLDEAEEQEFREAILAYYLLWRRAPAQGWSRQEIDREAEVYLKQITGVDVDFEVADALRKLMRLGLIVSTNDGRWQAVAPQQNAKQWNETEVKVPEPVISS